jgi:Fur family peroxide stress response transcriptional regulator
MEEVIKKYSGRGFKMTPQRIAILDFLEGNTGHPSAEDIYKEIKKKHPTVSFATIYNTLETLKKRREIVERS